MTISTNDPARQLSAPERPPIVGPSVRPLTATEFNTAMVHLYRGEVGRANTWRMRLDGTTNWAVLTTGATLSFGFSSEKNTHVMILVNSLLIFYFMYIEARRYMFYDLWRTRVRLMETANPEEEARAIADGATLWRWCGVLAGCDMRPACISWMKTWLPPACTAEVMFRQP